MLKKWKSIITNWINCYFEDGDKEVSQMIDMKTKKSTVNLETLMDIICRLKENMSLDESKSSLLHAHTVQEFINEKFPCFKFENGSTEPETEDEIFTAASLLLYFVCVNSKDVYIRNAMCKNLHTEDQKIILKYNKFLMTCSDISHDNISQAITDSCTRDIPGSSSESFTVSETPPALRSLHSEVRRLQVLLDTERFDRNFLQEELSRTNLKLEKLVKDKDNYKLEILNLKAKISLCCGQSQEMQASEPKENSSIKLIKQLNETEQCLVNVQEQMDEIQQERDVFKKKLDETKRQCDILLNLSQQETIRANQLAEELENERYQTQSLQELVSELQLHNRLNKLDNSQVECDDLDISLHAPQNNISVCSEACANVIEVQLGEERAKIIVLERRIQDLENKISDLNKYYDEKNEAFIVTVSQKDSEIQSLKHRIDEEIEIKNSMKLHFDNEINKLSSDLSEVEASNETSRRVIDSKIQEIQTLQEEKLSLIQSLNSEVMKLENVIKNLQNDIEAEKISKNKIREEYDKQIMLLNDKALNRNNELFELQDKIVQNGEMIENLQMQLRKEKELKDDISNKHNTDIMNFSTQKAVLDNELQSKRRELSDLQLQLKQYLDVNVTLKKELEYLNNNYTKSQEECSILAVNKDMLVTDVINRDAKIAKIQKELENLEKTHSEMNIKMTCSFNESQATMNTLKSQLQDEIQYKQCLQNKLSDLEEVILLKENINVEKETKFKAINEQFVAEKSKLQDKINQLVVDISDKDTAIKSVKNEFKQELELKVNQVEAQIKTTRDLEHKLECHEQEKTTLQEKINILSKERDVILKKLEEKDSIEVSLREKINESYKTLEESNTVIKKLEESATINEKSFNDLQKDFIIETSKLAAKLTDTEKSLIEFKSKSNSTIEKHDLTIKALCMDKELLNKVIRDGQEKVSALEDDKILLIQQHNKEINQRNFIENEYLKKCVMFNDITSQYNAEILKNKSKISQLCLAVKEMEIENSQKSAEIKTLEWNLSQLLTSKNELLTLKDTELTNLLTKVDDLETLNKNLQDELNRESEMKKQDLEALESEIVQLKLSLEVANVNHEVTIKEKNSLIMKLERNIQSLNQTLDVLKRDIDADIRKSEKTKLNLQEINYQKDQQILEHVDLVKTLNETIDENKKTIAEIITQNNKNLEIIEEMKIEVLNSRNVCDQEKKELNDNLATEKAIRDSLESEKKNLLDENRRLLQKSLDDQSGYKMLETERNSLVNEKEIMIQELLEEKHLREIVEKEKETIAAENKQLSENIDTSIQEKEFLTQKLVDEELNKKILEQEKCNLAENNAELAKKLATEILNKTQVEKEFNDITTEKASLIENIAKLKTMINVLENEKATLYQQIECCIVDKEDSRAQIDLLKNNVKELTALKDIIIQEKTEIIQERDLFVKNLNVVKQKLDYAISEKESILHQFEQISQKYSTVTVNSEEEIKNITSELIHLQSDYKNLKGAHEQIVFQVNGGFDALKEIINTKNLSKIMNDTCNESKDLAYTDKFNSILDIARNLIDEVIDLRELEKILKQEINIIKGAESDCIQTVSKQDEDIQNLQTVIGDYKTKLVQQNEYLESNVATINKLNSENDSLRHELTTIRIQLDEKVHSLKDKLIDNESVTDKLKQTYECQIDNLNLMVTKLTSYLKDKTTELDAARNERDKLQEALEKKRQAIKSFEDEIKSQKQIQEKIISEFESERQVLKNMITVTESVMEDQKFSLNKVISVHLKTIDSLQAEIATLKELVDAEKDISYTKLNEKENAFQALFKDFNELRKGREKLEAKLESETNSFQTKVTQLTIEKESLSEKLEKYVVSKDEGKHELKIKLDEVEKERDAIKVELNGLTINCCLLQEKLQSQTEVINKVAGLEKERAALQSEKTALLKQINQLNEKVETNLINSKIIDELTQAKVELEEDLKKRDSDITSTEARLQSTLEEKKVLSETFEKEKHKLADKCNFLQEYKDKAIIALENQQKDIDILKKTIEMLGIERENVTLVLNDKDLEINDVHRKLIEEKNAKERYLSEIKELNSDINDLRQRLDEAKLDLEVFNTLRKENEELIQLVGQRETIPITSTEKSPLIYQVEKELRHLKNQVDNSTDSHTSVDSYKTISDLEAILQDKNRTITSLQSDITYLKTLIAESENKLLDVSKELELSKENCQQLSYQIKKIVHQKNDEIADLKKQVSKMSVAETRATQIVKLSARYQAMIVKRVAEIKNNTILKELTNLGNAATCDGDVRRNLTAGSITMEDLENFLETTDRHLRRCSEKQIALQKERDRLSEVNRINESEVINMRKFLTELSVSVKTFNSMRDLYNQKLSRVVSLQRTVRREVLNLEGHITDATMCKLERGYAAAMQDLSECAMNMERWVERCIGRTVSSEKIKQAFTSELDRVSLATSVFQNASLEVQLEELENSFQKLLEEVSAAKRGEGVRDAQSVTVMEVRAEYEDKLNRMKAKMKQLYQEQISIFKEKQKDEISALERELDETRNKLEESSKMYEKHIRSLTTELWNVGEKFLMKKDEAEWLRKTQRSGSLMSLQHVHSTGLVAHQEEPSRPSDSHSLRSLPLTHNNKERGVHMVDEEGEVFDNRWLKELQSTPRKEISEGQRLSELRWRNSLCPPHLKSSYPAETQFAPTLHEEDIKMSLGGRGVRKEVGITAYKKPGPPTPSKQAGRLSATDSELRESLRVEAEPNASRKTSTPSRLRSLFRSNKNDTTDCTPRARRLSNIFRKKQ